MQLRVFSVPMVLFCFFGAPVCTRGKELGTDDFPGRLDDMSGPKTLAN